MVEVEPGGIRVHKSRSHVAHTRIMHITIDKGIGLPAVPAGKETVLCGPRVGVSHPLPRFAQFFVGHICDRQKPLSRDRSRNFDYAVFKEDLSNLIGHLRVSCSHDISPVVEDTDSIISAQKLSIEISSPSGGYIEPVTSLRLE